MGKQTKRKQEEIENQDKYRDAFSNHAHKMKIKSTEVTERPLISDIDSQFIEYAIKAPSLFKCNLKGNNREKKLLLFAKYLFAQYKIPKILEKVWEEKKTINNFFGEPFNVLTKKWFVCVGTGGSLYKNHLKSFLTKKEGHIFINCPFEVTILEGLVYSVAMAESGDVGRSLRIAKSKINEKNINEEFWRNAIRFFAQKDKTPDSINEINDLVDYIQHEKATNNKFSLFGNGWTLTSLKKRMIDWHYALRREKALGNYEWEGHLIDNYLEIEKENEIITHEWTIKQIKSSKELYEEGSKQHHCVSSYKNGCISGNLSIWSLRYDNKRKVTIELRNNGAIVQARGYANRYTTKQEDAIINRWAKANNLYCTYR